MAHLHAAFRTAKKYSTTGAVIRIGPRPVLDPSPCLCYIVLVDITWLGYSCFRIKSGQIVIITDPFPPELGYNLGKQSAQIVTVSHQHPAHAYIQGIQGSPHIVQGPGEYEIGGVLILGIQTCHDAEGGARLGRNAIYLIEIDGLSICHLGDLGHGLTSSQVGEIGSVDILFVPVGGNCTINAAAASQIIRQLDPRVVVPMHYATPELTRELEPVDVFFKEMGLEPVSPQSKLSVSRSNLPESTKVFVLSPG